MIDWENSRFEYTNLVLIEKNNYSPKKPGANEINVSLTQTMQVVRLLLAREVEESKRRPAQSAPSWSHK